MIAARELLRRPVKGGESAPAQKKCGVGHASITRQIGADHENDVDAAIGVKLRSQRGAINWRESCVVAIVVRRQRFFPRAEKMRRRGLPGIAHCGDSLRNCSV